MLRVILIAITLITCGPDIGISTNALTGGYPLAPAKNGTRLKHAQYRGADGAIWTNPSTLIDVQLSAKWSADVRCSFIDTTHGIKCVPDAASYSGGSYYSDDKCTKPIGLALSNVFYCVSIKSNKWGLSARQYSYSDRVYTGQIYTPTVGPCGPYPGVFPFIAHICGAPVPASEFVSGEEVTE